MMPSGGPGPGKGPNWGPGGGGVDRKLASLAAYTGLVGSLAIAIAGLEGIDLWSQFRWGELDHLRMAVVASVPLQLLNAALLLPTFSTNELPAGLKALAGHYVSNNPTADLSPAAEAAFAVVDVAAGELLYRGVALTFLGHWLEDRVYEGGLDELLTEQLPAAAAALGAVGGGVGPVASTLGVYGLCECAVAAAVTSYVVCNVLWKSERAVQRLELVMGAVSSAAEKASRTAAARRGASGDAAASSGEGSASKQADAAAAAAGPKPGKLQMAFGPGTPAVDVQSAGRVMRSSAAIQATRDGAQSLLLNAVFIATGGNLAASFAVSLANQLIISALQRRAMQRMRKRNAAFAKELLALTKAQRKTSKGAVQASQLVPEPPKPERPGKASQAPRQP
ncbi:hypothetical protein GPECTOR_19g281 [Gonium pectorale]|uniref:Uncharacterized protein n=1 Tax=Gonium pectorale TaxID=33097 RepID=A0A150GKF0_GONPE|nr:hypothetical protein GPECTOR_19g281 [Gonium pectorale]|eukprot:KXZ49830.1 hypothetical protein GPECTOR_19g281 [Gonium pectorale]